MPEVIWVPAGVRIQECNGQAVRVRGAGYFKTRPCTCPPQRPVVPDPVEEFPVHLL